MKSWAAAEPKIGGRNYPEFQERCRWLEKRFRHHAAEMRKGPKKGLKRKADEKEFVKEYYDANVLADYLEYIALQLEALLWDDMVQRGLIERDPYRYKRVP